MDVDADDEIISELPVYLSNALSPNVHVHQFPLLTRPLHVPPNALLSGKRITARIKPGVRRLEIHVPVDTRPEVWNLEKAKELGTARAEDDKEKNQEMNGKGREGEDPRLSELRLRSEEIPQRGCHMLAILRNGKLHLHPISEMHQFRPTLTYLDILSRKNKRSRGAGGSDSESDGPPPDPDEPSSMPAPKAEKKSTGEVREVQVTTRKIDDKGGASALGALSSVRRDMLHAIRMEEDEDWQNLEFYNVETNESGEDFEGLFSLSEEPLNCKSSIDSFIKEIKGL